MLLKVIPILELDDNGWKDYYNLGRDRSAENVKDDNWQEFKKERLEQYEQAPAAFKMEEYLLTYDEKPFAWIAHNSGNANVSFIFHSEFEEILDEIVKLLLDMIYKKSEGKDLVYFWSDSAIMNDKLKLLGAELIEENEDNPPNCQFILKKALFGNNG